MLCTCDIFQYHTKTDNSQARWSSGGNSQSRWSGGAMVLGEKNSSPTNLDSSKARAFCTCSRCGWGLFGHFFSLLAFLSPPHAPPLWATARYRLKYRLKGPLNPKQPTNSQVHKSSRPHISQKKFLFDLVTHSRP